MKCTDWIIFRAKLPEENISRDEIIVYYQYLNSIRKLCFQELYIWFILI